MLTMNVFKLRELCESVNHNTNHPKVGKTNSFGDASARSEIECVIINHGEL